MLKQADGTTLPGWRDFERLLAAIVGGRAPEGKDVFDIIVPSTEREGVDYGISVKSKALSRRRFGDLESSGRVYMELANSPAKFWDALYKQKLDEDDFKQNRHESEFGGTVLRVVEGWHQDTVRAHEERYPGRTIDLEKSIHLVVSYSVPRGDVAREYQLHAFQLQFPPGIVWRHRSEKSLLGEDPHHSGEVLIDWYALSGGQLKYYPRASECRFSSPRFSLKPIPRPLSVEEKAARYWPEEWLEAGGVLDLPKEVVAKELAALSMLVNDAATKSVLANAASKLGSSTGSTKA